MRAPAARSAVCGLIAAGCLVAVGCGDDDGDDGGGAPQPWKFVSMPDHLNEDIGDITGLSTYDAGPNSTNAWHEDAIAYVLDAVAAEDPEFVLVAGDLVNGHWDQDASGRQIFGPVGTRAEKAAAIDAAADLYYPTWKARFNARGLTFHTAIGDHEIGDNDWAAGTDKSHLVATWKQAWVRHFTRDGGGAPVYAERPVGTAYEDTAYAFTHRNLLVVTVDVFRQDDPDASLGATGSVVADVSGGQLSWLEEVLADAQGDPSIDHVIVQGHTPVLAPVRKQNSSGLTMPGAENTDFWQAMVQYGVDLYFAGEVHHMTASHHGGVEQLAHGGIMGYAPNVNYLVGTVYPDRIELELKWIDMTYNAANTTKLWQAGSNRPWEEYYVDAAVGFTTAGTLTIDTSSGVTIYRNRTGYFVWYGTFPPPEPVLLVHLPMDEAPGAAVVSNAGATGAANDGVVTGAAFVAGTLGNGLAFGADSRVLCGVPPTIAGASRTAAVWVNTTHAGGIITMFTMGANGDGAKWDVDVDADSGGVLELGVGNGRTDGTGSVQINDGAWHHVAVVLPDGGDSLADVLMYVDAQPISFSWNTDRAINTGGGDLILAHAANSDFFQQFYGTLDDLAIWGRALGATDLKAIVNLAEAAALGYDAGEAEALLKAFAGSTDVTVDGTQWQYTATGVGGADGEVLDLGGGHHSVNLGGGAGFVSQ